MARVPRPPISSASYELVPHAFRQPAPRLPRVVCRKRGIERFRDRRLEPVGQRADDGPFGPTAQNGGQQGDPSGACTVPTNGNSTRAPRAHDRRHQLPCQPREQKRPAPQVPRAPCLAPRTAARGRWTCVESGQPSGQIVLRLLASRNSVSTFQSGLAGTFVPPARICSPFGKKRERSNTATPT